MKNLFSSKLNRPQYNAIKIALVYVCCFALSASIAFGCCYAYFSSKISGEGSVASGLLILDYTNNTSNNADLAVYISRDNVKDENGDIVKDKDGVIIDLEKLIVSEDDTGEFYTYFMPGDEVIVRGTVSNNEDSITAYVLLKVELITHENVTEVTESDILSTSTHWFNLDGEELSLTESNQVAEGSAYATTLAPNSSVVLDDNDYVISCTLLGENVKDNTYSQKSVTVKLTVCGFQAVALDSSYTDEVITNTIIAG